MDTSNVPVDETRRATTYINKVEAAAAETQRALQNERSMTLRDSFKLFPKAIMFSLIFSTAIIMEGYDTNLIGNLYAFPQFKNRWGDQVDPEGGMLISARWQTLIGNIGQLGSIFGLFLNGIVSERFGFKITMQVSMVAMIGAIFLPFFSNGLPMYLAGAVVQGIPWGIFQTLAVTYAADVCPVSLRAYLTTYINLCWVIGQLISSGILRGMLSLNSEWSYRIPFAIQWVWPIPIMIGTYFSPESPWWLIRHGRLDEAKQAMLSLTSRNTGVAFDVDEQITMMKATNELEMEQSTGSHYWDCFRGTDLRRTEISTMCWLTQTFCGTAFMGYSTQFYQRAGLNVDASYNLSVGQSALGFCGTILAWGLMMKAGRRTLYIWGLIAGCILLIAVGVCGAVPQNNGAAWAAGSLLLVYFFAFQLTIGPVCYSLVAEIPSTRLRIKTVAIARAAYNAGGFINNALMPQMLGLNAWNWGAKTGFFWAGIDVLFIIWCYFRLPEPKGLTYSEIDLLFEHGVPARQFSQEMADRLMPDLAEVAMKTEKREMVEHAEMA